jgi:tyrosyl-tRNA synthetase
MSKSYGNYIAFNDTPKDIFGKIMSIGDDAMATYYKLLLCRTQPEIEAMKSEHPMLMKKQLAELLVDKVCGAGKGKFEREQFEKVFSKGDIPDTMPEFAWGALIEFKIQVDVGAGRPLIDTDKEAKLYDLMAATKLPAFASKKECRRMIEQGAVKVNIEGVEQKISDVNYVLPKLDKPIIVQAGKRNFFKILP